MAYMRILILLLIIFIDSSARAQVGTDTLSDFFKFSTAQLIPSPNGGFVTGTNGFRDSEKLQAFYPSKPYSVLGAWVWIGTNTVPTGEVSNTCLKLRKLDITPTNNPPFIAGIKSTVDSAFFDVSSLNASTSMTQGMNWMPFAQPVLISSPYAIGLTFDSPISIDSLRPEYAIMHSTDDSVAVTGRSWERWNGSFKRILDSWGLDIDLAVFPVIDTTLTSISNLQITKPDVFPNPANEAITIRFSQKGEFDRISLYDAWGKLISTNSLSKDEMLHTLITSGLSSGNYLIHCEGKHSRGSVPIIIAR
jgi:hypothetical protein